MGPTSAITITVEELHRDTVLVRIATPGGDLRVLCEAAFVGRELHVRNAHIEGLSSGAVGRSGLNGIARKVLETYDVDVIFVEGASRTTGSNVGRPPRPFRYPRLR
ncbi:hypothetical protein MOX02_55920 [Methylobacterium oxalidis]|uniref:Uncharacterized protein n=1 Tax=Methylobacterium oxalidis TaxID=944322 RepID=A0A512JC74_9HYPH|nr:hypothetical protein MOX02_55920 [Methylobacterium oxalidis]GLS63961.1 hypothetical protein GCM10007888_23420 [Methylobacterium oxalidis]